MTRSFNFQLTNKTARARNVCSQLLRSLRRAPSIGRRALDVTWSVYLFFAYLTADFEARNSKQKKHWLLESAKLILMDSDSIAISIWRPLTWRLISIHTHLIWSIKVRHLFLHSISRSDTSLVVSDIQTFCKRDDAIVRAFTTHCISFLIQNMQDKNNVASQKYHHLLFDVNKNYRDLGNYSLDSLRDFQFVEASAMTSGGGDGDDKNKLESQATFLSLVVGYLVQDFLAGEVWVCSFFFSFLDSRIRFRIKSLPSKSITTSRLFYSESLTMKLVKMYGIWTESLMLPVNSFLFADWKMWRLHLWFDLWERQHDRESFPHTFGGRKRLFPSVDETEGTRYYPSVLNFRMDLLARSFRSWILKFCATTWKIPRSFWDWCAVHPLHLRWWCTARIRTVFKRLCWICARIGWWKKSLLLIAIRWTRRIKICFVTVSCASLCSCEEINYFWLHWLCVNSLRSPFPEF